MEPTFQLLILAVVVVMVTGVKEADDENYQNTGLHAEDLKSSATGYGGGGGNGGYFQYARVPGYKEYEFGYRKGNPYHFQERSEQGKGHTFRTKVRWGDKKGGYGEHYWEYNHAPKYGGGHGKGGGYGH
ncbi:uncharacterized protein LOC143250282 [Tachypleus tridentatus]|uniref:uncharacterized protein LOC143250282 n=1 Tax=Tachypleus tridentatus TaxID=6853 RepID=UPI003FD2F9A3